MNRSYAKGLSLSYLPNQDGTPNHGCQIRLVTLKMLLIGAPDICGVSKPQPVRVWQQWWKKSPCVRHHTDGWRYPVSYPQHSVRWIWSAGMVFIEILAHVRYVSLSVNRYIDRVRRVHRREAFQTSVLGICDTATTVTCCWPIRVGRWRRLTISHSSALRKYESQAILASLLDNQQHTRIVASFSEMIIVMHSSWGFLSNQIIVLAYRNIYCQQSWCRTLAHSKKDLNRRGYSFKLDVVKRSVRLKTWERSRFKNI